VSIGALPLTSNLSRIRSATLPSALWLGRFCGPVHIGVRTGQALQSLLRALKLKRVIAVARTGRFVVSRLGCRALALHL